MVEEAGGKPEMNEKKREREGLVEERNGDGRKMTERERVFQHMGTQAVPRGKGSRWTRTQPRGSRSAHAATSTGPPSHRRRQDDMPGFLTGEEASICLLQTVPSEGFVLLPPPTDSLRETATPVAGQRSEGCPILASAAGAGSGHVTS